MFHIKVGDTDLQFKTSRSQGAGTAVICAAWALKLLCNLLLLSPWLLLQRLTSTAPKPTSAAQASLRYPLAARLPLAELMTELSLQMQGFAHMLCAALRNVLSYAASDQKNAVLDSQLLSPTWQSLAPVWHLRTEGCLCLGPVAALPRQERSGCV